MRITTVLLLLLSANRAHAQSRNFVHVEPISHLRRGVDAWPRIANPSTPAEQSVNATLDQLNQRMAKELEECDANYRDFAKFVNQPLTGKNAVDGDWKRRLAVTMMGPRYLSIVAKDEFVFCGGAHPNSDTLAMVFDLTTGRPVNWTALIAESANAGTYSDNNSDGTMVDATTVPALTALTVAHASDECKNVFQNPQAYQLWPDAKSGTLIAEPFGLPHVVAACAEDLRLTPDQARKLGFGETLLTAIVEAHQRFVGRVR